MAKSKKNNEFGHKIIVSLIFLLSLQGKIVNINRNTPLWR